MATVLCNHCQKETIYEGARPKFCAQCGAPFSAGPHVMDERVRALLQAAADAPDAVKQYDYLRQAQVLAPDCFEVERELLYLGRLYERGGKPDYSRIPYWPLDAFGAPDSYTEAQRRSMLEGFLNNPQLERVLSLAEDREAAYEAFLVRMMRDYVHIFIAGRSKNTSVLGFRRRREEHLKKCAMDCAQMLMAIQAEAGWPLEQKRAFQRALTAGFVACFSDFPARAALLVFASPELLGDSE